MLGAFAMIPAPWKATLDRARLDLKQWIRSLNRARLRRRRAKRRADYADWIAKYDTIGPAERQWLVERLNRIASPPRISVLIPTYKPNMAWFREAVESVQRQIYPHWQLCIADDASASEALDQYLQELQASDDRIRVVRRDTNGHICHASNSALALAQGEWIALLDHDDVLPEHALLFVAEAIRAFPEAGLIYSDEDHLGPDGERESPYFKPDWNYDLCLGQNMVCHLCVIHADLVQRTGGFRPGLEGAQDHDLVLRVVEHLQPEQIIHIPHVLYHWRIHNNSTAGDAQSKPYARAAGLRAVSEHLQRTGKAAHAELVGNGRYRVHWELPSSPPLASILIPTRNQVGLLRQCIETLERLTDYPNREVLIIDNGSDDAAALRYLDSLRHRSGYQVIRDDRPFNYSALNNLAARKARGDFLVLLNNDIEILEPGWLTEMISIAARPEVGAVGAKLLYPDRTIQHAGVLLGIGTTEDSQGVAGPALKGLDGHAGGPGGRAILTQSWSAVTAACMVVSKARFDQVGGLDELHLAVAYNDVDLCLRLREAGFINIFTPHAVLIHHESISRGRDVSSRNVERFNKERDWMIQRWATLLRRDPCSNPNLSLAQGDLRLADPPRVDWQYPWFEADRSRSASNA
ncbi:MAG: glycosyltransferase family 2 protein [Burkholderiales bacterium]